MSSGAKRSSNSESGVNEDIINDYKVEAERLCSSGIIRGSTEIRERWKRLGFGVVLVVDSWLLWQSIATVAITQKRGLYHLRCWKLETTTCNK